jgi:hypothetical protein
MSPSPDDLLNFLFSTIARKLPPINLREGAAVARYLHSLAWEESTKGPNRELLNGLSKVIWGIVSQFGAFKTAERKRVIEFLEKNQYTHLVRQEVAVHWHS